MSKEHNDFPRMHRPCKRGVERYICLSETAVKRTQRLPAYAPALQMRGRAIHMSLRDSCQKNTTTSRVCTGLANAGIRDITYSPEYAINRHDQVPRMHPRGKRGVERYICLSETAVKRTQRLPAYAPALQMRGRAIHMSLRDSCQKNTTTSRVCTGLANAGIRDITYSPKYAIN